MRLLTIPTLAALFIGNPCQAQDTVESFSCKANDRQLVERIFRDDPEGFARTAVAKTLLDERTQGFTRNRGNAFVIPVVFHVIHDNGPENISDAQIMDAVRILNEDFNKLNPDWPTVRPAFLDIVADVGVTFRLAQRDPVGNCTNGITRMVSPLTYEGDYAMTQLIQWPRERYMNIWVGASANGAAGYTNYPWVLDGSPQSDGIVVKSNYVGSIGTGEPGRSRVLTHEVGHWLNLMHCWGNSNEPGLPENCETDDGVADTPLTRGWTSCSFNSGSCGSVLDNVENYMEYAYCDKMFTEGQADRMIAALTSPVADREQLWQPENLSFTGMDEVPVLCAASFTTDRRQLCTGQSVTFTDVSFNSVTQRTWEFPGGSPGTSTEAVALVTYASPGTYPVTLTVTDGITTLTASETIAVDILPDPGAALPLVDGFEATSSLSVSDWTVVDPDADDGFTLVTNAAASGSRSVRLSNDAERTGRMDELISATYDLSSAEDVVLTFRHAYAQRQPANEDQLRIYVSNNCGLSWSLRKQLWASTTLTTGGTVPGPFVPQADEWAETVVTNIGISQQVSGFRFKFQFVSDGGNDLFLDDINLNGSPVGILEGDDLTSTLSIRPNPANATAQASITMGHFGIARITILDMLGRPVTPTWSEPLGQGTVNIDLPIADLARGLYLVHANLAGREQVIRLVLEGGQ